MLRHFSRNIFFFQIFNLGNIFENFDKEMPKKWFFSTKKKKKKKKKIT